MIWLGREATPGDCVWEAKQPSELCSSLLLTRVVCNGGWVFVFGFGFWIKLEMHCLRLDFNLMRGVGFWAWLWLSGWVRVEGPPAITPFHVFGGS